MSVTRHDVIIIGTGPGGANAALELAGSGLDVLVLEKESLPRHKPCGGAMPNSVRDIIDVDIDPVISNRTPVIKIYNNYKDELQTSAPGKNAPILVLRDEFDTFLIDEAISRGNGDIVLREESKAVFNGESDHGVSIIVNDADEVQAKYLVAADGANSRIAKATRLLPNRKYAPALEAEIITSDSYYEAHSAEMIMNLFCLPQGYGWIFPKEPNRLSCGVGAWGERVNIREELKRYIDQSLPGDAIQSQEIKGHPIPIYQGSDAIATKRVLLTGDAAALVDPVSGEGIRHALLSGKLAAAAIMQSLKEPAASAYNAGKEYQKTVDETIGAGLKRKLKFASLAFRADPDFFYETFVKKQRNIAYTD